MMKNAMLWKRILREGLTSLSGQTPRGTLDLLQRMIISSPIIVDTRPFDGERDAPVLSEIGPLSFPFDMFWVECSVNDLAAGTLVVHRQKKSEWGCLSVFCDDGPPTIWGDAVLAANPDGGLRYAPAELSPALVGSEWGHKRVAGMAGFVADILVVLSCKNVSLEPRRQTDTEAVKEATRRNGGHAAGYRYHVLVVRPAGSKPGTPGIEIGTMPRHVCRGHFAEYGPEYGKGLLFGRLAGRFFIPPHMKGDAKNGTVLKDYEVRAA